MGCGRKNRWKIRVKAVRRACINKSTFMPTIRTSTPWPTRAPGRDGGAVVASLPSPDRQGCDERTSGWPADIPRLAKHQRRSTPVCGFPAGLFINQVEAALRKCIAERPAARLKRRSAQVVLSFCVQGMLYTFTSYCGQMDETRLVALLYLSQGQRRRSGCEYSKAMAAAL